MQPGSSSQEYDSQCSQNRKHQGPRVNADAQEQSCCNACKGCMGNGIAQKGQPLEDYKSADSCCNDRDQTCTNKSPDKKPVLKRFQQKLNHGRSPPQKRRL